MTSINTKNREFVDEVESLQSKLAETEEKLADALEVISAIQSGEVDAVVVSRADGDQVFTLRGAEYAYRALVEAMNEGAATLAIDGTILYCNRRFSDLLGIQLEQIIGHPIENLVKNGDEDLLRALVERALVGTPAKSEVGMVAADGRSIPTLLSLSRMKIEEPAALCMVVTDLTESKKWEQVVSAGRLATSILESSAEGIAVCDREGNIVSVNDALKNLSGSNPILEHFDRAFPLRIQTAGHPACFFTISSALERSIRGQEVNFCRSDGVEFSLLLSSGHILDPGGIAGCVLTLTDITGRKRVERALVQSEKLAAVGRLAASIAHEINNPLESITNVLYLAQAAEEISDIRQFLEIADQELRRVAAITNQTLRFHKQATKPTEVGCEELIDSVISVYQGRLANSNITVQKRSRATRRIRCFEGEIRQVLSNLVGNSIDAMGPAGGHLLLRSSEGHDKLSREGVFLTVADDGAGMSRETALRAFEPFFTTKGFSGTGLGLWVSQEILQRHRGLLVLRSSQGTKRSGTVVRVFLPFAAVAR